MKKHLYTLALLLSATALFAQTRYLDPVFSNVTKTSDITYSTSHTNPLKLDVYEPTGDTAAARPLIIMAHGGSFVSGNKTQDGVVTAMCNNFAKRGYVTASINYRLANFFDMLDSAKAIEAVLKAISDGKSAIRFFRKSLDDTLSPNPYRVDTNWIFAGGNSAGAVLYMHVMYLDSTEEAPPVMQGIINNNGGFEGNSGNDGYSSALSAVINLAGGLNVPEFVGPGSKPSVNFHGSADATVPYGCDYAQSQSTPVRLCGLGAIEPLYQQYGVNHVSVVYPGAGHVPWQGDANKMTEVDTVTARFLYNLMNGVSTSVPNGPAIAEGVTIYPNPANGVLNVRFETTEGFEKVQLMDITGKVMEEQTVAATTLTFNANRTVAAGIYFVRLVAANGTTAVSKVVFN